jgi:hypothetical protein
MKDGGRAWLFLALVTTGCGGTEVAYGGSKDAGEPHDGSPADAAPDRVAHGDAPIGAACTSSEQCAGCPSTLVGEGGACVDLEGGTCLGGPFTGGYCTVVIAECSEPGGALYCPTGSICFNGAVQGVNDVQDYCLASCGDGGPCRSGYECCMVRGFPVCAPPSACGQGG